MNVYLLVYTIGIESGYKELIGIYETEEKAEAAADRHRNKLGWSRRDYVIKEIELDKEVRIIFAEW